MPIESIEEFSSRMKTLGTGGLLLSLGKTMGEVALNAEKYAKTNATGTPRVVTGRLRSSIFARVKLKSRSIVVQVSAGGSSRRQYMAPMNNDPPKSHGQVPYARFQENRHGYLQKGVDRAVDEMPRLLSQSVESKILGEKVF